MYRYAKKTALWTAAFILAACSTTPQFSDVMNKDWSLVEARITPEKIIFDRNQLKDEGFGDIFTLRVDANRVNGVAVLNRYFAPYAVEKQDLTVQDMAQTMMYPLREPEKLKEKDYFAYLQKTTKWNIVKGNLELYSKGEDGTVTVLVFAPTGK